MREKWRKWTDRLPSLPRKWRVVRNLALALLVLAALPVLLDWPLRSSEAVFRQLEREALLSPSELVLQWGEAFLAEGEDWVAVGKVERYDTPWKPFQNKKAYITNVAPKEGVVVVALPDVSWDSLRVAVTGLPEGTVEAGISLTISGVDALGAELRVEEEETFHHRARREEGREDWIFFTLRSHGDHPGLNRQCVMDVLWRELTMGSGVAPYPYTLTFEDEQGKVLETVSGTLPPNLHFLRSGMR